MNNKRKYQTTMGAIVGLMVLSGGLFAYENVYVAKQKEANKVTIYVAKQDIQAHTAITSDMFVPLQIDNTSVLAGYVLDLNSVANKELKGGLLQGEPLTKQRLEAKDTNKQGDLTLKITPDVVGDIKPNDNIRVFVQLTDKDTGIVSVKQLFDNKKVLPNGDTNNALLSVNKSDQQNPSFNIVATEQEVKDYFVAKESGKIMVVKIDDVDTESISSDTKSADTFDAKSKAVQNASKQDNSTSQGQAIATYTVQKGDTLDSLSLKFKTKKETISALNNRKQTFKPGEMIQVPAN